MSRCVLCLATERPDMQVGGETGFAPVSWRSSPPSTQWRFILRAPVARNISAAEPVMATLGTDPPRRGPGAEATSQVLKTLSGRLHVRWKSVRPPRLSGNWCTTLRSWPPQARYSAGWRAVRWSTSAATRCTSATCWAPRCWERWPRTDARRTGVGDEQIFSEEALRPALTRNDEVASKAWMNPALMRSVREALDWSWHWTSMRATRRWSKQRRVMMVRASASSMHRASGASRTKNFGGIWLAGACTKANIFGSTRVGHRCGLADRDHRAALSRDRVNAESALDKLKKKWGRLGFTTQSMNRCQSTARACAPVYTRSAPVSTSGGHHEPTAIVGGGGSGGQPRQGLYLTPMHAGRGLPRRRITNVRAALRHIRVTGEQFKGIDPWGALLHRSAALWRFARSWRDWGIRNLAIQRETIVGARKCQEKRPASIHVTIP